MCARDKHATTANVRVRAENAKIILPQITRSVVQLFLMCVLRRVGLSQTCSENSLLQDYYSVAIVYATMETGAPIDEMNVLGVVQIVDLVS